MSVKITTLPNKRRYAKRGAASVQQFVPHLIFSGGYRRSSANPSGTWRRPLVPMQENSTENKLPNWEIILTFVNKNGESNCKKYIT
jgi:hypothetical protein